MKYKEIIQRILFRVHKKTIHLHPHGKSRGNVLLSYITYPFLVDKKKDMTGHTNYFEARAMADEFLSRGYAVDVIDTTNASFIPKKNYDFFIDTHDNMERLAPLLNKDCVKILHTTTCHWLFNNTASYQRASNLFLRRNVALKPERLLTPRNNSEHADILLLLGNEHTQSTYGHTNKPIHTIPISTTLTYSYDEHKDFKNTKKNFVWLGGAGAVHKGVDLLLEAFSHTSELTLTLCGKYTDPQFVAVYDKEINRTPQIVSKGNLDLGGKIFDTIRKSSTFIISPSCAEGQSGSVIIGMHAGLIPIISKESGINTHDFGITLKNNSLEEIEKTAREASLLPDETLREMSRRACAYAQKYHTRAMFTKKFKEFVILLESKTI